MKKLVFAIGVACLSVGAVVADGTSNTNVTVVVIDREAAQKRMDEARRKYEAMTDAERAAKNAEIEKRRKEFEKKNVNNPYRIVSRMVNTNGTVTITRANGTTQTFRYVDRKITPVQ